MSRNKMSRNKMSRIMGQSTEIEYNDIDISNLINPSFINIDKVDKCWNYSAVVRFLSGVDICICILNGLFYNPLLYIITIIPLYGYRGAIQFCSIKTIVYIIYLYTSWFGHVIEICEISKHIIETNSTYNTGLIVYDPSMPLSVISISCIIKLMNAIYVSGFICILYNLTTQELSFLRKRMSEQNINQFLCC